MTKALQRIMALENELRLLDSYILELETKHKFYWFTVKKRPPISDVSYMSKGNLLYGFKQTPNYNFIEHHDLRFVTHSTLDGLIEQF